MSRHHNYHPKINGARQINLNPLNRNIYLGENQLPSSISSQKPNANQSLNEDGFRKKIYEFCENLPSLNESLGRSVERSVGAQPARCFICKSGQGTIDKCSNEKVINNEIVRQHFRYGLPLNARK